MTRQERARIKINKCHAEINKLRATLTELYNYQMQLQEEYMVCYNASSKTFRKELEKIKYKRYCCESKIEKLLKKISRLRIKYDV